MTFDLQISDVITREVFVLHVFNRSALCLTIIFKMDDSIVDEAVEGEDLKEHYNEEFNLRHRKIIDCAKETIENG